ncbi:MAG: toll/interleukin-1 receptor domain-containing protein, partial [Sulfurimonas sp.]|nr:toll/interleukin-1 receptor domain-containing protein [Sulfurimonas sp.]
MSNSIEIFVSYSHEDIEHVKNLQNSLKDYKNIKLWTDENIRVGDKFNKKIYTKIKQSDIIIFFFSIHLMKRNFSYVKDVEIPLALIENRKRSIQILPLIVDKDAYTSVFYEALKKDFVTLPEHNKQSKAINEFQKNKWWKPWKKVPNPWDVVRANIEELVSGSDFKKYLQNKKDVYSENVNIDKIENFDKYITREIEVDIKKWWETNTSSCYIQGDEGVGKTFLALNIANKMQMDGIISFYLKSLEWNGCKTIKEILVQSFGFKDENEINDINEFLNGFEKPILIVLDGVNEKGALEVVDNILNDYFKESL